MKKLYYNCPLQAAYMTQEFGVQITIEADKSVPCETNINNFEPYSTLQTYDIIEHAYQHHPAKCYGTFKYFIHSDSLPIFEPQVGDLVEHGGNGIDYCIVADFWPDLDWITRIIQRNGKPFFMPLVADE